MIKSEQINELAAALSKAQGEMKGATKDSSNPFFKSKYADLASVWEAFRDPFAKNGLSLVQSPRFQDGLVFVESLLLHTSGQWISGEVSAQPKDHAPQAVGSTITYLRRYAAQSIAGVCPEDDDGNAGSKQIGALDSPSATVHIPPAQKKQVYDDTLKYLEKGDAHGVKETFHGFNSDERVVLQSMFNSQQRTAINKYIRE